MVLLNKPVIIGITGGTASGKSSMARKLYEEFKHNNSIIIVKEDDYYKDQSHLTYEERCLTNYDHPLAFDHDLLIEHLDKLSNGDKVEKPIYDFTVHNRSDKTEIIEPTDVIILEGLFVLENKDLRDRLNIKIYVDTPADVRFIRRLKRDMKERGRSMESVMEQYLTTVRVMHEEFIEPTKKYADIIILEGSHNVVAMDLLKTKIYSILNQKMI